jgi:hypothetical protein
MTGDPGHLAPPRLSPAGQAKDWLWGSVNCAPDLSGQRLLASLRAMLARVRPAQVAPGATRAFSVATALYATVPHRDLGIALAVNLRDGHIGLGWCVLASTTPADDVTKTVAYQGPFEMDIAGVGLAQAVACAERELWRPVEVRLTYKRDDPEPVAAEVLVDAQVLIRRRRSRWLLLPRKSGDRHESTFVTLAGNVRPPVAFYGRTGWTGRSGGGAGDGGGG